MKWNAKLDGWKKKRVPVYYDEHNQGWYIKGTNKRIKASEARELIKQAPRK